MAVRTTAALVEGIIATTPNVDLTPFIAAANSLTTNICGPGGYDDTGIGSTMELIERWLSAHLYTIFDNQLAAAKAGTVAVRYQYDVKLMLFNSMYGQQAMMLDYKGLLAAVSNTNQVKRQINVALIWLGKRDRYPGDVSYGADITISQ
jgi:hypothetical protein